MSVDEEFVIILAKKFGYLEKRVTYLEVKCRGQQNIIEKLQKKFRKIRKKAKRQDQLIVQVPEDSVNSFQVSRISRSNESLKGNFERSAKKDKKLTQKLIVQLGVRCGKNPTNLNSNRAKNRKPKISQSKTENTGQDDKILSKTKKGSLKKSHICSLCPKLKYFQSFSALSKHMRVHTGERPFKCKICSKSFNQLTSLKTHSRIHTGERPFRCKICSKSFRHLASLNSHTRIHTGERPFKCKICSKSFRHLSSLNPHTRIHIHTGERPFKCKIFSKSFNQLTSLKKHSRIHTGEKPYSYSCSNCGKGFASSDNAKMHERIHDRKMST